MFNNAFNMKTIFSLASRERCMAKLKKIQVPRGLKAARPPSVANASMLVPVCCIENQVALLYIVRSSTLHTPGGQITFPGGIYKQSESPEEAALRQVKTEIGLPPANVDVWGQIPSMTGHDKKVVITPVIGTVLDLKETDLTVNNQTVSEVFAVPLEMLCDPKNQFYTQFKSGYALPVFMIDDYKIWGVPAYLTHILLNSLLPRELYNNDWTRQKIDLELINRQLDTVE